MKSKSKLLAALLAFVCIAPSSALEAAIPEMAKSDEGTHAVVSEIYGKLSLSFEADDGQNDPKVTFLSHGSGYSLFLTNSEAVLALTKKSKSTPVAAKSIASSPKAKTQPDVLRMKLVGATPAPKITGQGELPGKVNYFIGNDPEKWRTNVATYAKVRYERVYPGIDLVYYGNQRQLEYDFVVAPGAGPARIRLGFSGA